MPAGGKGPRLPTEEPFSLHHALGTGCLRYIPLGPCRDCFCGVWRCVRLLKVSGVSPPPLSCSSWGWQYFLLSALKTSVGTGGLLRVGSRDESSFPGIPPLACTSLGLSFRDLKILFKLEGPQMQDELNFPTPSMVHINPIFIDCWGGGGPSRKWRDSPKTAAQRQR